MLALLATTLTTACSNAGGMGLSDSLYVETMAELQRLQREEGSAEQRDSVLRAQEVTPEQLERAAVWLARHPEDASTLWRAIDRQSRLPR